MVNSMVNSMVIIQWSILRASVNVALRDQVQGRKLQAARALAVDPQLQGVPLISGRATRVEYDSAVCLRLLDPLDTRMTKRVI